MTMRGASRLTLVLAAALVTATLAGCSTSGHAHVDPAPGTPTTASSSPDFPTSVAPVSTSAQPTTPTGRPTTAPIGPHSPTQPVRTVTTHDPDGGRHVVKIWVQKHDATCYDHAYGQPIITYLTTHPCTGMDRILATTTTTTTDGRAVGFSLVNTGFTGTAKDPYAYSSGFRKLVVKDGTGSIDDLLREGYRLPSGPTRVPSPDAFACLGQDNGVSIYDLWYLDTATPENDKALEQLAQDTFLQL